MDITMELTKYTEPDDDGYCTVLCHWFAACTNPANGLRPHPVLGPVPICHRCDEKMGD